MPERAIVSEKIGVDIQKKSIYASCALHIPFYRLPEAMMRELIWLMLLASAWSNAAKVI